MPVPVVGGWVGGGIIQGIVSLAFWLAEYVGKRAAVGIAVGGFTVAGWVALQVAAWATVNALTLVPSAELQKALALSLWFIPPTFWVVMTGLATLAVAKWLYKRQWEWVKAIASVS